MYQGLLIFVRLFISLRLREASSSDCPPERNTTPTRAGGTVLLSAKTVLEAISWDETSLALGLVDPGVTMLGFKRHPSRKMLLSLRALKTAAKTRSVTF